MSLRTFLRSERGSSFESMALAMSVMAIIFVAAADVLHYASKKNGALARLYEQVDVARAEQLRGDVDYTPTGSIAGMRHLPSLNPCAAALK